ncbi:2,3-diketo-L-gulonate-binding periplasmic protein YiaO precursor [Variibacter gotjawalensis]|uniref:2,3-diketo-L-gulonate-binding periplasmic protein YiaO n=1 Tax=Variibacter gotjawalensis TaxID=1333996 RepID=A0A0S3PVQ6_9BRAD|nr:TRAP transporter substrate-binding protein [Variibacter gotjawalensis]NIK45773.1 tripartite ATP-independent transporter DctP family solute receptor [Variibacter gotjawalensis]RZS47697.1 tripartite ATP-independent transporter DctP family solute receptor [Variibacter gotjawalensis]BAT59950.1 2,3-diketo-L-gulonate-binding periplasmic protein YiaO precursor [Variibacter gotjawalensis]
MRIATLTAALLMTAFAGVASAQSTIKIGYTLPPNSHYGTAGRVFGEEIAKLTNGRYKAEQFPANALGGEREMIESLQLGNLEMVITSSGPVGNFVPEVAITDIPFLFRDTAHARAVLDSPIGQDILARFPAKGLVALGWGEQGFRHLTNNKRPVKQPEDLKGLKIRTMENQVHMTAFRTLGASPTPMAWPEVIGGLQQGTIDGQENPLSVIVSAKLSEVQKHLTLSRHVYSPALILISKRTFDALSADDKKAFQEAGKVAAAAMRKHIDDVEKKGVEDLKAAGFQVVEEVDTAKFQTVLAPAFAEYAKKFGADKIEKIRTYK